VYGVEPAESAVLNGGKPGDFMISSISFWSSITNFSVCESYCILERLKVKNDIQDSFVILF